MYRIIPAAEFVTSPWKNGGGITHEIARDGEDWGWRLSIAQVDVDGDFSIFAGMARVLTVLDGAGMDLHHAGGVLAARPMQPVRFSGDMAIKARLIGGGIRDFNLIYDPERFDAEVEVLAAGDHGGDHGASPGLTGILALQPGVRAAGVPVPLGGFALGSGPVAGSALRVIIRPR